jgi:hypothetical protein
MTAKTTRDTHTVRPLAGRTVELANDFHGTSATVRVNSDGLISDRVCRRVHRDLCGIDGCTCGGVRGGRYRLETWGQDTWQVVDTQDA